MRINMAQPVISDLDEVEKIKVTTSDNVCSTEAYTITVPSKENRYIPAFTWGLTDEECDMLLEKLAAARAQRLMSQEKAYESLRAKFGGDVWDNAPVEIEDEA